MLISVRTALPKGSPKASLAGLFCCAALLSFSPAFAAELGSPSGASPRAVAEASNEGELAMKGFQIPKGFKVELAAAEPHLANPVAFDIDYQNRLWVVETFRHGAGVTDIRGKMSWLDEDLAARTVDDRLAMLKRHEGERFSSYEKYSDRLRLVLDTDGDRKFDRSTVFADGFTNALDGIAAGVLSRGGKVYFANLPNLWLLEDKDNDGVADARQSLHYGFGVRIGFLGHDLHGLIMGPDGRLYFSIGDRGANIEVENGRRVGNPDTGVVFRCEPDGSNLEVFAQGLRNPQELAFDQFGNLFTGDNNSDGGDRARIVYLVEGGDSGWRIGWQFLERPGRGAWNLEKMWHPQNAEQPAFLIPPITNLTDGPSGFAFNPGTGLPAQYDHRFFLVDFHGSKQSGIYSFGLSPKGAGFELQSPEKFIWGALPTDVGFGVEGGIYFADWVQGWNVTGKGRVYRVFDPESDRAAAETKSLLLAGFKNRNSLGLQNLLAHADLRVRQEAQFELVRRQAASVLAQTAASASPLSPPSPLLARVHAVWGLGQLARTGQAEHRARAVETGLALAKDADPEIRAQAARMIGDARLDGAADALEALLGDPSERVRSLAGISAGQLGRTRFAPAVLRLLAENADRDPILRHAGVSALAGMKDLAVLEQASGHPSAAVRMGVLLALRRLERAEIARFLTDPEPRLVLEAARAINDLPISGALRELAALAGHPDFAKFPAPLARRVVNANYRYGTRETAQALAEVAANGQAADAQRAEALRLLAEWERPSGRDAITGLWRPLAGARPEKQAVEALQPALAALIQSGPDSVRAAAARSASALQITEAGGALLAAVRASGSPAPRVAALRALAALRDPRLAEAVQAAQSDPAGELRSEALKFQSELKPSGALAQIRAALDSGPLAEKQAAFATLGTMTDAAADEVLLAWLDKLEKNQVAKELELDLLEAAGKRQNPAIAAKLKSREDALSKDDPLAPFRVALLGGSAVEGKKIFFERAEAACLRCHKIEGAAGEGGQVGPELTRIGASKDRAYLLESIVFPNKHIAEGFQSALVTAKDGTAYAGVVQTDTAAELVLNSPEDGIVTIKKQDVASREPGLSSMPEGLAALLTRRDLRDLVEYLSSLK